MPTRRTTRTRAGRLVIALLAGALLASALPSAAQTYITRPVRPLTFDTTEGNFRLHFTDDPASPHVADPAFVAQMGEAFEEAYTDIVGRQGWLRPADDGALGGDGRIDVYLTDFAAQGIVAEGLADADNYGDCDPDRCSGMTGSLQMDNDFAHSSDVPAERRSAMTSTAIHELHHVVQFAEAVLLGGWMYEMTSMWMERVVRPDLNNRLSQVADAAAVPEAPLTREGEGDLTLHAYGRWPFLALLAEEHGEAVVRDAWRIALDRQQEGLGGFSGALEARGATFGREFAEYAATTATWPLLTLPYDELDGEPVQYARVRRADDTGSLPYEGQHVLDHTAYAVIDLPVTDAVTATIDLDPAVQAFVALVAVIDGEPIIDLRPAVGGTASATLDGVGDAQLLSAVVINADPTMAVRGNPFDELPVYAYDQVPIDLRVEEGAAEGPGADLADGERIGTDDPVSQAIATSQALFADGGADRVVLATADRFPDALAGAALASGSGPILLAPPGEVLDARVSEEIRRVAGDGVPVLVLGGTAAVSDAIAAQARLAAGDVGCTAPLPATCRFAGGGREDTAVRIAEVVLAEHGDDQVLIARADDFADALTGGAYAAWAGVPLLLTPSTTAGGPAAAFLAANPSLVDRVVLGGEAAVSEAVAQALGATRRVAGAERTATTAAIARELWGTQIDPATALLVNVRAADAWGTALAAAVASAQYGAPQLGVDAPPADLGADVTAYLSDVAPGLLVFGGTGLVSPEQLQDAHAAAS